MYPLKKKINMDLHPLNIPHSCHGEIQLDQQHQLPTGPHWVRGKRRGVPPCYDPWWFRMVISFFFASRSMVVSRGDFQGIQLHENGNSWDLTIKGYIGYRWRIGILSSKLGINRAPMSITTTPLLSHAAPCSAFVALFPSITTTWTNPLQTKETMSQD